MERQQKTSTKQAQEEQHKEKGASQELIGDDFSHLENGRKK
jgi:hypothetical protein